MGKIEFIAISRAIADPYGAMPSTRYDRDRTATGRMWSGRRIFADQVRVEHRERMARKDVIAPVVEQGSAAHPST